MRGTAADSLRLRLRPGIFRLIFLPALLALGLYLIGRSVLITRTVV
jgi:hypothetical protein